MRLAALADIYTYCSVTYTLLAVIPGLVQRHRRGLKARCCVIEASLENLAFLYTKAPKCKLKLCLQVEGSLQ